MVDGTNGFQRALGLVLLPTYPRESEMKTKVRNLGDLPKNTWRTQPQLIISNDLFGDLWLYIYTCCRCKMSKQTNMYKLQQFNNWRNLYNFHRKATIIRIFGSKKNTSKNFRSMMPKHTKATSWHSRFYMILLQYRICLKPYKNTNTKKWFGFLRGSNSYTPKNSWNLPRPHPRYLQLVLLLLAP